MRTSTRSRHGGRARPGRATASGTHSTAASTTKNTELPFSEPQVVTTSANAAGHRHERGDSTARPCTSTSHAEAGERDEEPRLARDLAEHERAQAVREPRPGRAPTWGQQVPEQRQRAEGGDQLEPADPEPLGHPVGHAERVHQPRSRGPSARGSRSPGG